MIAGSQDIPTKEVKLCVFFDKILLEENLSPYKHGEFPYVPMVYHYYGVGDVPAGFVRDLKDAQREVNKRRIQELHLLNTTANGGGWIEEEAVYSLGLKLIEDYRTGNYRGTAEILNAIIEIFKVKPAERD